MSEYVDDMNSWQDPESAAWNSPGNEMPVGNQDSNNWWDYDPRYGAVMYDNQGNMYNSSGDMIGPDPYAIPAGNAGGGAAVSQVSNSAPPAPNSPNKSVLDQLSAGVWKLLTSNPGSALAMGTGGLMAALGYSMQPGGKVRAPNGSVVQLNPQEQQFMNTMMNQAQQTASIATPVNQSLAAGAQRNAPSISQLTDTALQNLPTQMKTQSNISQMVNQGLNPGRLGSMFGNDLANGEQAQGNILNILQNPNGDQDVANGWKQKAMGYMNGTDPLLQFQHDKAIADMKDASLRAGGSGYETSTWYQNQNAIQQAALDNDLRNANLQQGTTATQNYLSANQGAQDILNSQFSRAVGTPAKGSQTVASLQTLGDQGGATGAGMFGLLAGKDPTATSTQGFSGLAALGNSQQQNDLASQMFNSQQQNQNRNMLLGGGAALFGYGAGRKTS